MTHANGTNEILQIKRISLEQNGLCNFVGQNASASKKNIQLKK